MTQETPVVSDQPLLDGQRGNGTVTVDLARIQKHVVELLAQLDRPPRTLRIQAGEVSVDISWAELASPDGGTGPQPSSPDKPAGEASGRPDEVDDAAADDCLTSPGVGVFYHAREPGGEPFVSVGTLVRPGQQIGIIEAMKLMIPIEADRGGRITAVLKGNGEPVEYGEPLFTLDVEDS